MTLPALGLLPNCLSTGLWSLDLRLGGWEQGSINEIYGATSSGRSLMGLQAIKAAQDFCFTPMLIDCDNTFDADWARRQGVDTGKLLYLRAVTLGSATDAIEHYSPNLVVLDSLTNLLGTAGDNDTFSGDLLRGLARLSKVIRTTNTALLVINQIRTPPRLQRTTTPGGAAWKGLPQTRIEVIGGPRQFAGSRFQEGSMHLKLLNSARRQPFLPFEVRYTSNGIDAETDAVQVGLQTGVLTRRGAWVTWQNNGVTGQGPTEVASQLSSHSLWPAFYGVVSSVLSRQTGKQNSSGSSELRQQTSG